MICPKCKAEYREGFSRCKVCDVDLVEKIINEENIKVNENYTEKYLITVNLDIELFQIKESLENEGIPIVVKHKGSGEYLKLYMGVSFHEKDIFVPEELYKKAKKVLDEMSFLRNENINKYDNEFRELYIKREKRKLLFFRIIYLIIIAPFIIGLILSYIR